jgi:hypothetical protein
VHSSLVCFVEWQKRQCGGSVFCLLARPAFSTWARLWCWSVMVPSSFPRTLGRAGASHVNGISLALKMEI